MRRSKQHLIYRHSGDSELKLEVPEVMAKDGEPEQTVAEILEKVCENLDWVEFHLARSDEDVKALRKEHGSAVCTVMVSEPEVPDETESSKSSCTVMATDAKSLITSLFRIWGEDMNSR